VANFACVGTMSNINLTRTWNNSAAPERNLDTSPPVVNVFDIDTTGKQTQQRERNNIAARNGAINYGSHDGSKTDSTSSKKANEAQIMSDWLQLMSPSYRQSYHQFIDVADSAIKFYDEVDHELEQMKAELEEFKEAYDQRTIHLSDGRRVYIDENGSYVYQDQFGGWNELEDSAIDEAKAKHQILGDQAISKPQKLKLDEYERKLLYTDAMKDQNRQEAIELRKAGENGDLSEDELNEGKEQIEKDKQEMEEVWEDVKNDRLYIGQEIGEDLKSEPQLQKQKFSGSNRNNQMFGENLNNEQPSSTPPTLG